MSTLWNPMTCSMPGLPVQFPESTQTHVMSEFWGVGPPGISILRAPWEEQADSQLWPGLLGPRKEHSFQLVQTRFHPPTHWERGHWDGIPPTDPLGKGGLGWRCEQKQRKVLVLHGV